jgi:hypothetical protein
VLKKPIATAGDQGDDITICVDLYRGLGIGVMCTLDVCYQLASGAVPIELLRLGFGEQDDETAEANKYRFDDLKQALGLTQTDPAQILIVLMSCAMPLYEVREKVSEVIAEWHRPLPRQELPVLYAVSDMLRTLWSEPSATAVSFAL